MTTGKKNDESKSVEYGTLERRRLLAQVAGSVAAGIVSNPSEGVVTASGVATVAVDIAEEILRKIGVP